MPGVDFEKDLSAKVTEVESIIMKYLPREDGFQKTIMESMNYSFKAGGKRLRPMMMLETYRMFGGTDEAEIGPFMAALEMIHTYSLIHDDLPAMDNDEYRRGRKTNHVVFGEAMAILAGDGLLNFAYETAFMSTSKNIIPSLKVLGNKAGIYGMVGGQVVDVESEKKGLEINREQLIFIHENKTGALIQAALMIGAIIAGADDRDVEKLAVIGRDIGVAFQIQDDILDIIGDEALLGKPIGSDEKNEKVTYVTLNGLDKAQEDQKAMSFAAIEGLKSFKNRNEFLEGLVEQLVNRDM